MELNFKVCKPPVILNGFTDTRWTDNTIYNHFESPLQFMEAVKQYSKMPELGSSYQSYIEQGVKAYSRIDSKDTKYSSLYEDVARDVKSKLQARGFTSAMLYGPVEFTFENTGCMSKQRALMGRRDCYYKDPKMNDGKLFHDIYINLSYSAAVSDTKIERNAYALYALCKELSRLAPIRVFVVNHVGTDIPTCYSYVIKKFGQPIKPKEFLFFTSDSKRTFGWATYGILNGGSSFDSAVGSPSNSVSIASFNLQKEIDTIWDKLKTRIPSVTKRI